MRNSKVQFIRSLGYLDPHPDDQLYSALMLQPRIIAGLTVIGLLLQTPWLFLALSAALGWSAFVPTRSLFDAIYNYVVARPRGLATLEAAPAPRRFAGGLAAVVTLTFGVALLAGARSTAWVSKDSLQPPWRPSCSDDPAPERISTMFCVDAGPAEGARLQCRTVKSPRAKCNRDGAAYFRRFPPDEGGLRIELRGNLAAMLGAAQMRHAIMTTGKLAAAKRHDTCSPS